MTNNKKSMVLLTARKTGFYFLLLLVVSSILVPYLWMLSGSFKSTQEIMNTDITRATQEPGFIPRAFTCENYIGLNSTVPILHYLKNSIIICSATMVIATTISFFAAYALSRFRFQWKKLYVLTLYMTQMFPGIAFLIPYFVLFLYINKYLGLRMLHTYWGLVGTYTSFALPFSILMMRNFINSIPQELDEQAQIDGCSQLQILTRIIFPLALPGIVSVSIFSFLMGWNEVLFASILTNQETKTIAIGLLDYINALSQNWPGMMAACIITILPVFLFFSVIMKQMQIGPISGALHE